MIFVLTICLPKLPGILNEYEIGQRGGTNYLAFCFGETRGAS